MRATRAFVSSACLALTHASYNAYFFPSARNSTCPGWGIGCAAPFSACAYDSYLDKYYCCGGEDYPVCQSYATDCAGSQNTSSTSTILCDWANLEWCCLRRTESCTQRTDVGNLCIATQENIIAGVSQSLLNDTYSSISSENPHATAYTFDAASLARRATATSSSRGQLRASSETPKSDGAPTGSSVPARGTHSSGPSGGVIAGIVIGAALGVAAAVVAVWSFLRSRRRQGLKLDGRVLGEPSPQSKYDIALQKLHGGETDSAAGQYSPAELSTPAKPTELATSTNHSELEGLAKSAGSQNTEERGELYGDEVHR